MNQKTMYDIIIIGAGAAGLMSAVAAKTSDAKCDVLLLEKNAFAGKKLYATGNGRCNFLNRYAKPADYFSRDSGRCFLDVVNSVFSMVPIERLEEVFNRMGIIAVQEEEGRLYPRSFQAKSIVDALCQELQSLKVPIVFDAVVKSCQKDTHGFTLKTQDGKVYQARNVILASGGKAGCQYGSEGEGYKLAEALGHKIVKPIPALTQLITQESTESISGVRVRADLSLYKEREGSETLVSKDAGEVQFTKEGISGICTFNISRFLELEENSSYKISIDPFYDYSEKQVGDLLFERHQNLKERTVGHILYGLIPDKLCDEILKRVGLFKLEKVKDIPTAKLRMLSKSCKSLTFTALRTKSWKDAQVTAGGISLCELKSTSLESILADGLFFAGEVLDIDGPCGGYNLSWAFASGYRAGILAAEKGRC